MVKDYYCDNCEEAVVADYKWEDKYMCLGCYAYLCSSYEDEGDALK